MAKIFTIEGIDGSGKQTLTLNILEELKKLNVSCMMLSFPTYEMNSGKVVRKYLTGGFRQSRPHFASHLYTINRGETMFTPVKDLPFELKTNFDNYSKEASLHEILSNDDIVCLMDRYWLSNVIHQAPKIVAPYHNDPMESFFVFQEFVRHLYYTEFETLGLPRPTKEFLLELPAEVSMERLKSSRTSLDEHETISHLKTAAFMIEMLKEISSKSGVLPYTSFNFIKCLDDFQMSKSPNELTQEILTQIKEVL